VIIPDVNLLVYAHNTGVPEHVRARAWWEQTVNGAEPVGLAWAAALGFVRLMSNSAVVARPQPPAQLLAAVESMIAAPGVRLVAPGSRHTALMRELFEATGAGPRLVTNVHLAALAIELDATLASNDADFRRFAGLRLVNPVG
jgi:uncharacterized protein